MTVLHVVGQNGDKELATFLFENGELTHRSPFIAVLRRLCLYG